MLDTIRTQPDPHAHCIKQPGRRLLRSVLLDFVRRATGGGARRPVDASLNLTSYIDFLLVTVIFLLMSFSASGDFRVDPHIVLPRAENVIEMLEAPTVAVNGNQVLVDGTSVGSIRAIEERGTLQKIDGLFDMLRRKRELWVSLHPGKPFPGVCLLQVDSAVPALVVKSVFQTAAYAGYGNVSFMVRKRDTVTAG